MPNLTDILTVVIGVTFVYLILSLLTTWVQEFVATLLSLRAKNLADILQNMLDPAADKLEGVKKLKEVKDIWTTGPFDDLTAKLSESALKAFYDHPIICSLSQPKGLPSYIPAENFTSAMLDLLNRAGAEDSKNVEFSLDNIRKGIQKLEAKPLKDRMQSLLDSAEIHANKVEVGIADFRNTIESWFNSTVERGSGWYKRRIQMVEVVVGILTAIVVNADTIGLAQSLWENAGLRQSVAQAATIYVERGDEVSARAAQQELANLGLPIGWSFKFADADPNTRNDPRDFPITTSGWLAKGLGLLITGFAISQGSPIWFDLLNRLVNFRGSGGKPTAPAETQS